MFQWFKSWRERRRMRGRALFCFWDGQRQRYADPFRTLRALDHHGEMNLTAMADLVDKGVEPESTVVINGVAEVFGVTRWDEASGTGLTDWEITGLLSDFLAYLESLKKNGNPGPISSEPTDSPSSTGPDSPGEPTNPPSACGSAPNESNCDELTASCAGPPPHGSPFPVAN